MADDREAFHGVQTDVPASSVPARVNKVGDKAEWQNWQSVKEVLLLLCTFFVYTKPDPIEDPERKLRDGEWGAFLGRYIRIYGDDLFLYASLILTFVIWIVANCSYYALYAENRTWAIFITALLGILIAEQWKLLPHRWLSRRVEQKQPTMMSSVRTVMSLSTTLPGSIFDLSSKKWFLLPLIIIFTHGPDLFAGLLTNVSKSGAHGILRTVDFTLGPVGGGIRTDEGSTFSGSGLKFLSRDSAEEDALIMSYDRSKKGIAYVPHMPQELFTNKAGISYMEVKDLPVYRVRSIGVLVSHEINPRSLRTCRNNGASTSSKLSLSAYTDNECIRMGLSYSRGSTGITENFQKQYELCRGTASVKFERTEKGPIILDVRAFQKVKDSIGEIKRIQDGEHSYCDGFLNILSFGVSEASGDVQSIRTAVAWLVRSATEDSDTGYGAEDFEKGSARGIISQLRYKLPNGLDYFIIIVGIITIITQFYFVGFHPSALPRSFDTAAIHCGRVLSEHTTRCATRDWKFRSGQKDASRDFTVVFGMVHGPEGDPLRPKTILTDLERGGQVNAVHLEWGLPEEIVPAGFVSANDPGRFCPTYVGTSGKQNKCHDEEISAINVGDLTKLRLSNVFQQSFFGKNSFSLQSMIRFIAQKFLRSDLFRVSQSVFHAAQEFVEEFCPPQIDPYPNKPQPNPTSAEEKIKYN